MAALMFFIFSMSTVEPVIPPPDVLTYGSTEVLWGDTIITFED